MFTASLGIHFICKQDHLKSVIVLRYIRQPWVTKKLLRFCKTWDVWAVRGWELAVGRGQLAVGGWQVVEVIYVSIFLA